MKVFVTGVGGQLGHDVMNELVGRGYEGIGSDIAPAYAGVQDGTPVTEAPYIAMDITDKEAVKKTLEEVRPDVIVHCAAWTAVDMAEDDDKLAKVRSINVDGTQNIADMAKELDAKMVYLSTDYVFDGQGTEPWEPDDKNYKPLNVYGETKLAGEQAVSNTIDKYFIVRIAWVFGKNGKNFIKTMLQVGRKYDEVKVVDDQIGTPTYTYDLARLLVDMIETDKYGYYHATNEGGYISWYDFTKEIFKQAGYKTKITPVTTAEYGLSKAARPFNSRLDKSKLVKNGFKPLPTWQDAVARYLKELDPSTIAEPKKVGQISVERNVGGIEGLCVITPAVHGDARGYFMETYNQNDMKEAGFDIHFVQDNQSMSTKGVLRGLHFQKHYPQCKLVRVVRGSVFDVAVDLRKESKTYGKWFGVELTAENKKQFLIPEGFAHGFLVLSDEAEFCYKVNDFWHQNDEGGMAWNDPEIGVVWPHLKGEYKNSPSGEGYTMDDGTPLNLSDKDQKWFGLKDTFHF
jgi:dTDP-4-dehydrorhamnose reductase